MARARHRERPYIGVGGHVVGIDAESGGEVWRTKLKGSMFVTVSERGGRRGGGGELDAMRRMVHADGRLASARMASLRLRTE